MVIVDLSLTFSLRHYHHWCIVFMSSVLSQSLCQTVNSGALGTVGGHRRSCLIMREKTVESQHPLRGEKFIMFYIEMIVFAYFVSKICQLTFFVHRLRCVHK